MMDALQSAREHARSAETVDDSETAIRWNSTAQAYAAIAQAEAMVRIADALEKLGGAVSDDSNAVRVLNLR